MRILNKAAWSLWFILQFVAGKNFDCPKMCTCKVSDVSTTCHRGDLTKLPQGTYFEMLRFDLSFNLFESVPENMSAYKFLQHVNLSHNRLSVLDRFSLEGLNALQTLDLSYNLFKTWLDIHPDAWMSTPVLAELNLSHNSLRGFLDLMIDYPLKSNSLKSLLLINCSITNLLGDVILGMTKLETLNLANNPLIAINTQIKSTTLRNLNFAECNLQRIHANAIAELSNLTKLILSKNYQLKKFNSKSLSLKILDLSHCDLESIPSNYMPDLTEINLKGNHLRHISANVFSFFPLIRSVDLSNNALRKIDLHAFRELKSLEILDLSYNTLTELVSNTFITNNKLYKLSLSRNYLSTVGHLAIQSLKHLDLSVCEIREISRDSLIMMPKLQSLNLSRNLISHVPDRLEASELHVLDLSMCRIYALTNLTFSSLGRLRSLNLTGNRLNSGIKPSFFYGVTNLRLEDNFWACECESDDFRHLYHWLFDVLAFTDNLRCSSPEKVKGFPWERACYEIWFPLEKRNDSVWIYSVSLVVLMTLLCCVIVSLRQFYQKKASREEELREQEREETREHLRQLHQRNLQYSRESIDRNAPDPRELQTPPSYAEAVSMPRLNLSCNSLAGSHRSLHSLQSSHLDGSRRTKLRRKRRKGRQENKYNVSETQSAASVSHANCDSSNSEDEFRPNIKDQERNVMIESSF